MERTNTKHFCKNEFAKTGENFYKKATMIAACTGIYEPVSYFAELYGRWYRHRWLVVQICRDAGLDYRRSFLDNIFSG